MDYAEPTQRALLVEGIRPVLPLIRNTPYGKRIQNKLQREQMDPFSGYHNQSLMVLGAQGIHHSPHGGGRHIPQALHQPNPLGDVYGTQNGMYAMQGGPGQGNFNASHLNAQLHGLQPQSIDGYVLQGNSSHGQGISPSHAHGSGFTGVSTFANVNAFGGAGTLNDPYQRSTFGYGI